MLVVKSIEYSRNPVLVNEVFILGITVEEITAVWRDLRTKTWSDIKHASSWENVKLKYF